MGVEARLTGESADKMGGSRAILLLLLRISTGACLEWKGHFLKPSYQGQLVIKETVDGDYNFEPDKPSLLTTLEQQPLWREVGEEAARLLGGERNDRGGGRHGDGSECSPAPLSRGTVSPTRRRARLC